MFNPDLGLSQPFCKDLNVGLARIRVLRSFLRFP